MSNTYCVYLTFYKGNKLPKWYIGSSNENKILKGYNGSIKSKKWKEIYNLEQKENKHLFKTRILSKHDIREEALKEELRLQRKHKVVKNTKYLNESYATINGMFGRDISGKNNPMFGKTHKLEVKQKLSILAKQKIGVNNSNYGNFWSNDKKEKMSNLKKSKKWMDDIGLNAIISTCITKGKKSKWFKIFNSENNIIIKLISFSELNQTDRCLINSNKDNPVGIKPTSLRELKKINKSHLIGCYSEVIKPTLEEIENYYRIKYEKNKIYN